MKLKNTAWICFFFVVLFTLGIFSLSLNKLLNFFPTIKQSLLNQIEKEVNSIGHAKKIELKFFLAHPTLYLYDFSFNPNDFFSGTVHQVALKIGLKETLLHRSPRIIELRVNEGVLKLDPSLIAEMKKTKFKQLHSMSLDRLRIHAKDLKIHLNPNKLLPEKPKCIELITLNFNSSQNKIINLDLKSGAGHVEIQSELKGLFSKPKDWHGLIYLKMDKIDLESYDYLWPGLFLPKGVFSSQSVLKISQGKGVDFRGKLQFKGFKKLDPLIKTLVTEFHLDHRKQRNQLRFNNISVRNDKQYYQIQNLTVTLRSDYLPTAIQIDQLDQKVLLKLLQDKYRHQFFSKLNLPNIKLNFPNIIQGSLENIYCQRLKNVWSLRAKFRDLSLKEKMFRVDHLSGKLNYQPDHLKIYLDSHDLKWQSLKHKYRFDTMGANIEFSRQATAWVGHAKQIYMKEDGLKILGEVHYQHQAEPRFRVKFDVLSEKPKYWSQQGMMMVRATPFSRWLSEVIVEDLGSIQVQGSYIGPLQSIKLGENAQLESTALLKKIHLNYDSRWPQASDLTGQLKIKNRSFQAQIKHAVIGSTPLSNVSVKISDYLSPKAKIDIHGHVVTALTHLRDYLFNSPLKKKFSWLKDWKLSGKSDLNLDLHLPLNKGNTHLKGRLSLKQATLEDPRRLLHFNQINALIHFNENHFNAASFLAQLFQKRLEANIQKTRFGEVIHLSGLLASDTFLDHLKLKAFKKFFKGEFEYDAALTFGTDQTTKLRILLKPIQINTILPYTLLREARNKTIQITFDKQGGVVRAELNAGKESIRLNYRSKIPEIYFKLNQFDLDQIKPVLDLIKILEHKSKTAHNYRYFVNVDQWQLGQQVYQGVQLKVTPKQDGYKQYQFKTPIFSGTVDLQSNQINVALDKLVLNSKHFKMSPTRNFLNFPKQRVILKIGDLAFNQVHLGEFQAAYYPSGTMYVLKKALLKQPGSHLKFSGEWNQQHSFLKGVLDINQNTMLLKALRLPELLKNRSMQLKFNLSWPENLWQFKMENLVGQVKIRLQDGLIEKLDPVSDKGLKAIQWLNFLSVSNIVRKLNLDRVNPSKGSIDFDSIDSVLRFKKGQLHLKHFTLDGSMLYLNMSGYLDLLAKRYYLNFKFNPYLTESLPAIVTVVSGPIAGAGIWIVNKFVYAAMRARPLYHYQITGPWHNPVVTRKENSKRSWLFY